MKRDELLQVLKTAQRRATNRDEIEIIQELLNKYNETARGQMEKREEERNLKRHQNIEYKKSLAIDADKARLGQLCQSSKTGDLHQCRQLRQDMSKKEYQHVKELEAELAQAKEENVRLEKELTSIKTCPVCYGEYVNGLGVVLPCSHRVCTSCVSKLVDRRQCPKCRAVFEMSQIQLVRSKVETTRTLEG